MELETHDYFSGIYELRSGIEKMSNESNTALANIYEVLTQICTNLSNVSQYLGQIATVLSAK